VYLFIISQEHLQYIVSIYGHNTLQEYLQEEKIAINVASTHIGQFATIKAKTKEQYKKNVEEYSTGQNEQI
jgi:hypothetical protein